MSLEFESTLDSGAVHGVVESVYCRLPYLGERTSGATVVV